MFSQTSVYLRLVSNPLAGLGIVLGMIILALGVFGCIALYEILRNVVSVDEHEAVVVIDTWENKFSRLIGHGHQVLHPLREKAGPHISLRPRAVLGECELRCAGGLPVQTSWMVIFRVDPFSLPPERLASMVKPLAEFAEGTVRAAVQNCLQAEFQEFPLEQLDQPGQLRHVQNQAREQLVLELKRMGIDFFSLRLKSFSLPERVRTAFESAQAVRLQAQAEACALNSLHTVLAQVPPANQHLLLEFAQLKMLEKTNLAIMPAVRNNQGWMWPNPGWWLKNEAGDEPLAGD